MNGGPEGQGPLFQRRLQQGSINQRSHVFFKTVIFCVFLEPQGNIIWRIFRAIAGKSVYELICPFLTLFETLIFQQLHEKFVKWIFAWVLKRRRKIRFWRIRASVIHLNFSGLDYISLKIATHDTYFDIRNLSKLTYGLELKMLDTSQLFENNNFL